MSVTRALRAVVLAAVCPVAALAAQDVGILYGTVRDSATGAPVAEARVAAAGRTASTDAAGRYRLAGVPAGTAVVSARRLGYEPAAATVPLAPGDSVRVDFSLAPRSLGLVPVVVTAGKRSQLAEQVVTSVAFVSESAIARRAVNGVDEAVDKAPGVQFLGGQVNIRGSSGFVNGIGARVLLLVDGVPANQGDRGGISWDVVPLESVERVEILKGAGSSLYGSAALGGVVNLITREVPAGLHLRVGALAGGFANPPDTAWRFRDNTGMQQGLDVTGSYGANALRGGLTASARHSDGYREQDRSDTWQLFGKTEWRATPDTRLRVTGSWTNRRYQAPLLWCERGGCDDRGLAYQPFKVDTAVLGAYTQSDKGLLAATVEHAASRELRWLARASLLRTQFSDHRRPSGDFGTASRYGLELRGEAHPSDSRVAVVGAEGARTELESDIFGNHTETAFAAYGEGEQRYRSVRFTAGARLDYAETDGGNLHAVVSPRVGAVLPAGGTVWRASVGRGFRSPSLAERFPQGSLAGLVSVVPNPDLTPETAWSFELGGAAPIGAHVHADAAVFWTEAKGLVEPNVVLAGNTLQIQFQNLARARLLGLDVALDATPLPGLSTTLAYTYLYARELAHDTVPARPLAFRPAHLLTLGADYHLGPVALGADFRYMSRYARVELYPPTDPILAPRVLDLRASGRAGPVTARLLVTNALNYVYNLVPQTLAPVRTMTLGATWTY